MCWICLSEGRAKVSLEKGVNGRGGRKVSPLPFVKTVAALPQKLWPCFEAERKGSYLNGTRFDRTSLPISLCVQQGRSFKEIFSNADEPTKGNSAVLKFHNDIPILTSPSKNRYTETKPAPTTNAG